MVVQQENRDEILYFLREFEKVFESPTPLPPTRDTDHAIRLEPGHKPVNVRPYMYPYFQKDEIERQVWKMLDNHLIHRSNSPFSSPVFLVKKKDRTWRALRISGLPFGLTNTPSTFQATMNKLFQPYLRKFVLIFLDDILIFSKSWLDHLLHIRQVLHVLQDHNFVAKRLKCLFGRESVEYLGHILSREGLTMDPSKVQAIRVWSTPTNIKEVRGFLGMVGYYRRFIRGFATIAAPLTDLLRQGIKFQWTEKAQLAFENLKDLLSNAPVLGLPYFDKDFVVETDALGVGLGLCLHKIIGHWHSLVKNSVQGCRVPRYTIVKYTLPTWKVKFNGGRIAREVISTLIAITQTTFGIIEDIRVATKMDDQVRAIIEQIAHGSVEQQGYTEAEGLLLLRGRIIVPMESALRSRILREFHQSTMEVTQEFFEPSIGFRLISIGRACEKMCAVLLMSVKHANG
ncbi:hypothetical protein GQ457_11G027680 [Hibiscus cannabinus]